MAASVEEVKPAADSGCLSVPLPQDGETSNRDTNDALVKKSSQSIDGVNMNSPSTAEVGLAVQSVPQTQTNLEAASDTTTQTNEEEQAVPPIGDFAAEAIETGDMDPQASQKKYDYEVDIPVTPFGLQLVLKERNGAVTFDGYAKCPDGSKGPSETENLVRNIGDVIAAANGTSTDGKTFREIMNMLRAILKEEEKPSFVSFRFLDGNEWTSRRCGDKNIVRDENDDVTSKSMALNVAYEALEHMRRANLEVEFGKTVSFSRCAQCLRASLNEEGGAGQTRVGSRIKKIARTRRTSTPCLICGSPVCPQHSSETFRKEKIVICGECSPLFSLDFIVDCLDITVVEEQRRKHVNHMVDVYDRAVLMLKYSAQYIDHVVDALEHNSKRNDKVGLGGSATGLVSGVAGVVGAATIFTPVGPPLLIASLLFGGSATAVQTGSEAVNYFSEPNKLADKIIALHAIVISILRVTDVLRNALLREQVRVDDYLEGEKDAQGTPEKQRITRTAGVASIKYAGAATGAATAARAGSLVGKNSRFFTRASTTALRTARFARFAGGALSAASIVVEARDMSKTMKRIRAGNPCEKADTIRSIKGEVSEIPDTSVLAKECEGYFAAMSARPVESAALAKKKGNNKHVLENGDILDAIEGLEHKTRMDGLTETEHAGGAPFRGGCS